MSSDPETLNRLTDLEFRLAQYHEHLEAALEHDRQFQLGATWGVVTGFLSLCVLVTILWAGWAWLNDAAWWWWILAGVIYSIACVVALGLIVGLVEKKRDADAAKLSSLPKWSDTKET